MEDVFRIRMACASLSILISPLAGAQENSFSPRAAQKAEALLRPMTLDEKVGQFDRAAGIVIGWNRKREDHYLVAASLILEFLAAH